MTNPKTRAAVFKFITNFKLKLKIKSKSREFLSPAIYILIFSRFYHRAIAIF